MVATDHLVDDYLRRLDRAAANLPKQRRAELVAEIREHLEEALRETDATDEVAIRNVLERIGPPDEIVMAATGSPSGAEQGAPDRAGRLEIATLIALVVPFLGWLIGLVLLVASRAWSGREKVVGVALLLLPLLLPLAGLMVEADSRDVSPVPIEPGGTGSPEAGSDTGAGTAELIAVIWLFFAGVPSAVYLGWRLRPSKHAVE